VWNTGQSWCDDSLRVCVWCFRTRFSCVGYSRNDDGLLGGYQAESVALTING